MKTKTGDSRTLDLYIYIYIYIYITSGEPKGSYLWRKMLNSFLSAGGAKLEIAAVFKPWAFQAYLGTDDGANKHQNRSS